MTTTVEYLEYIAKILKTHHLTLSTAESLTSGFLASRLTSLPGASSYFNGGAICYTNEMKQRLLGVDPIDLQIHSAVSDIIARQMAIGGHLTFETDICISTTGVAGPGADSFGNPEGLVYLGLYHKNDLQTHTLNLHGDRQSIIHQSVEKAIEILAKYLESIY